jgi:hypothetical protein
VEADIFVEMLAIKEKYCFEYMGDCIVPVTTFCRLG